MLYFVLFFFGLCFGSFVNALVWRIYKQQHVKAAERSEFSISKGRSMCVNCQHVLVWYDLVPVVSWVSLKGKCRYCSKPISWQYPIVELLTAGLFIGSFNLWPPIVGNFAITHFALWLSLITVLMALSIYDLRHYILPNKLVAIAGGITLLDKFITSIHTHDLTVLLHAVLGALAFGGVFYLIFMVSAGKWIGGGDVKLGFVLGAWLGGVFISFGAIFLASLVGTFIAGVMLVPKRATLVSKLPFGPLLIFGFVVMYFAGPYLLEQYARLLGV